MRKECTHSMEGKQTSQAKKPNFVSSNLCDVDSLLRKLCGCYEAFLLILESTIIIKKNCRFHIVRGAGQQAGREGRT